MQLIAARIGINMSCWQPSHNCAEWLCSAAMFRDVVLPFLPAWSCVLLGHATHAAADKKESQPGFDAWFRLCSMQRGVCAVGCYPVAVTTVLKRSLQVARCFLKSTPLYAAQASWQGGFCICCKCREIYAHV